MEGALSVAIIMRSIALFPSNAILVCNRDRIRGREGDFGMAICDHMDSKQERTLAIDRKDGEQYNSKAFPKEREKSRMSGDGRAMFLSASVSQLISCSPALSVSPSPSPAINFSLMAAFFWITEPPYHSSSSILPFVSLSLSLVTDYSLSASDSRELWARENLGPVSLR
ncbi:hypothetical protein Nepgr_005134 [Nepenthes gracilis]|uniref:Uncharacterized protein n=1 Tax=Nepenthes gracilis TaxID=150966 RepID=A0AAD3S2L0_NEPGR|nr:hypothetical protein Nepgr_005134 [Nepenthes gracilis]